jgi:hypothetical protein
MATGSSANTYVTSPLEVDTIPLYANYCDVRSRMESVLCHSSLQFGRLPLTGSRVSLSRLSKLELPIRKLSWPGDVHTSIFSSQNGPSTSQHWALSIFNPHIGKLLNFRQKCCQIVRSKPWKIAGIDFSGEKHKNPHLDSEILD